MEGVIPRPRNSRRPSHAFYIVLYLAAFVAFSNAATTNRRGGNVAATATNTAKKKVMEPAFESAGKVPGLQIWRIENFKPVAYPTKDYGKFYTGDSYIVLYTKEKKGVFSWDIHFWLGRETSQDEAGAAAILTVELDDQLGGAPVQHREVQEHESQLFLSHFKSGVRYLAGGVSSGFTHVDPNAFEKRLFHIKGKRNIYVKQVDLTIASMNKGDCFILDTGTKIYVYVGSKSKRVERLKAISAANQIRDQDHGGRAKIFIIDEFSDENEVQSFFSALGSGTAAEVPDESAGGDDEIASSNEGLANLVRVSDAGGRMNAQVVGHWPLKQSLLDTNDCFILDTLDSNLYVWIGKRCNGKEKSEAMNKAQSYYTSKHYPSWTHVKRIVEGAEPTIFRQYFQTWKDSTELHTRLIRSTGEELSLLEQKSGGEVPEFMPDDGSGELEVFRVGDYELYPIETENYGKFFGGDCYVIKYKYDDNYILYVWQGIASSHDKKVESVVAATNMDNELGGNAIHIRAVQNKEPKHFLKIFKGKLITFLGGSITGYLNIKDHDTYVEGDTQLFRIRGTSSNDVRASQQVADSASLESDDVFFVEKENVNWLWFGKGSNEIEKQLATGFVEILAPESEPTIVQEDEEPDEFWDSLGGRNPYSNHFTDNTITDESSLYHYRVKPNGQMVYEEITEFTQEDLSSDDIMILDTGSEVYVWMGNDAPEQEKRFLLLLAQKYLKKNGRENGTAIVVRQGKEPKAFTSHFPSWDNDLLDTLPTYEDIKRNVRERNIEVED